MNSFGNHQIVNSKIKRKYQTLKELKLMIERIDNSSMCLVVEHGGVGALLLDHCDLVLQPLEALEQHAEVGAHVELDVGGRLVVEALFGSL